MNNRKILRVTTWVFSRHAGPTRRLTRPGGFRTFMEHNKCRNISSEGYKEKPLVSNSFFLVSSPLIFNMGRDTNHGRAPQLWDLRTFHCVQTFQASNDGEMATDKASTSCFVHFKMPPLRSNQEQVRYGFYNLRV